MSMNRSTTLQSLALHSSAASQPRQKQDLIQRSEALLKLQHPELAPLDVVHESSGTRLIAHPVVGPTLHDLLQWRRETPYGLSEVLELLAPLCDALEYMHTQNIAHGNLHPNVIVQTAHRLVLTGFAGVAPLGPVGYRAPEHTTASPSGDVYALAIIVYELLTGDLPSSGIGSALLPPGVDRVLARALASQPHQRYHSPKAFLQALAATQYIVDVEQQDDISFAERYGYALVILLLTIISGVFMGLLIGQLV